jgi:uncharacterized protein (TIGR03435 family)
MRQLVSLIVLGLISGIALFAQDITGTWQGTLKAERDLRIVLKISKADNSGLKAVLHSIDQGGQGIPVSSISLQGSTVKMSVDAIDGTYEGKLSSDGTLITGTWTQGNPLPLILKRATPETEWTIPEPPPRPKPMAADAKPVFEVATIKLSKPGAPGKAFRMNGRQFTTLNTTFNDIITFAYGIHVRQVTGGPAWFETEKYDLLGTPDVEGQPNHDQLAGMVQKLLADRFQLKFHRDKKELSVYAIVVAKDGTKLTKSQSDSTLPSLFFRGLGNLPARNATMADLARLMQSAVLDKPVIDQTGLSGRYDFTLKWTPDEFQFAGLGVRPPAPTDSADAPPDLFTAMQQQLGLKLEPTKAPAEVLVIDHVEKPSEN